MLSDIFGVLTLEYNGQKPYHISTFGFAVTLPNGEIFYFDWNRSEGNSIPGTNKIQLILSELTDLSLEDVDGIQYTSNDLVNKIANGTITDVGIFAYDDDKSGAVDRLRVDDFYIEYNNTKYELNYHTAIHQLIDIFWETGLTNQQVIEKTYQFSLDLFEFPHSLQKYFKLMKANQAQQVTPPLLIIELYGAALEKLEPKYFTERRSIFYQESLAKDCVSALI